MRLLLSSFASNEHVARQKERDLRAAGIPKRYLLLLYWLPIFVIVPATVRGSVCLYCAAGYVSKARWAWPCSWLSTFARPPSPWGLRLKLDCTEKQALQYELTRVRVTLLWPGVNKFLMILRGLGLDNDAADDC